MFCAGPVVAQEAATREGADLSPQEPVRRTEAVLVESASKAETTLVNAPATMSVVTAEAQEVLVESASKGETTLVNAPATMSVVTAETLEASPAQNYADLLRSVPGMNVIQMSARDMNLTTRQGTSTLNNSQLVLVDGRSVYLDFFGLVLWDFVPSPGSNDIKQIEVVRGPASVVWGANALTGVVNIITKTPRENAGLALTLGAGLFGRDGGSRDADGEGSQYSGSFSYAGALDETWSYRLSAGYFSSDPYSRPVGSVALGCHPLGADPCRDAQGNALPGGYPVGGAPYPSESSGGGNFENSGTSQPKVDLRARPGAGRRPHDLPGRLRRHGGHDPHRHRPVRHPERLVHGLRQGGLHAWLPARVGVRQLRRRRRARTCCRPTRGTLQPVVLGFQTQTYDFEIGHSQVLGGKHVLTYGGNFRRNNFDITLAPRAEDRNEFGAYFQEEFFVDRFRLAVGGARRQVRQPRRLGLLAARERDVQADAEPVDPRFVQPRLPLALGGQQLPRPEHLQPDHRRPAGARARPSRRCGR